VTRERGPHGRFTKGHARVPGSGRRKGQRPKVLQEAKAACEAIIDDPAYRENLKARAINGELAPAMEVLLWQYAKGKPREARAIETSPDLAVNMSKVSVGSMTVVPIERLTDEELDFYLAVAEKGPAIPIEATAAAEPGRSDDAVMRPVDEAPRRTR
jgi:hypothetical protein